MQVVMTQDGASLAYVQRGDDGPALICVHGAGGTHQHWGYQVRDLSDAARVYAFDLPGHGGSALPGCSQVADYSSALIGFMDACGLDRAVLVGHSMGGAIALWTALEVPERVIGLGLVGTGGRLRVAPAILDGFGRDVAATIRLVVDYAYATTASARALALAEQSFALCDPAVYHDDFVACDAFNVVARLSEIRCPTAVVCGVDDRLTPPKYSESLRDRIPGAALTLVPDAGHMVMVEQPAAVTTALRALVRRVG